MTRPNRWPYVAKRETEKPRLNTLAICDNGLILNSEKLIGVKDFEIKRRCVPWEISELNVTLLVELV